MTKNKHCSLKDNNIDTPNKRCKINKVVYCRTE